MRIYLLVSLFLMSCGQTTVDLNELETFFRGRTTLFDNNYGNSCNLTLTKTDNGLEVRHRLHRDIVERFSFSDFEIIEKYAIGQDSKYFEIGKYRVIGQANVTYLLDGTTPCYELFY